MSIQSPATAAGTVHLFTDGACSGNPGPGGFGAILRYGDHEKELSGGFIMTTNNRMELLAVIMGLEALKHPGYRVVVVSDSRYVVEAVEKQWLFGWEKKSWKKVKNPDLWQRFLPLFRRHRVTFKWIKGHAGHAENERCDALAVAASLGYNRIHDTGFEQSLKEKNGMF